MKCELKSDGWGKHLEIGRQKEPRLLGRRSNTTLQTLLPQPLLLFVPIACIGRLLGVERL